MNDTFYAESWDDYRRRRFLFRFCFWLVPLVVFGVSVLLVQVFSSNVPFWILGGASLLTAIVSYNRLLAWLCPRCHKRFFCTRWGHNDYARQCVRCHLPKWSLVSR